MKKLVWLLVLINVGLLVYFNLDTLLPSAPKVGVSEIDATKITVLDAQQIAALPKKPSALPPTAPTLTVDTTMAAPIATKEAVVVEAPIKEAVVKETAVKKIAVKEASPPTASVTACYEWGVFASSNLAAAQSAVSRLALQASVKEQTSLEAKRFWVYKPPLKNAEAAQAKALELKAMGIDELFVVQDSKWENAISFGVFEDEQLATNLLNELKAKGVKDVLKALRNQGKDHTSLLFNHLKETEAAEIKKLKPDFPETNLKKIACN